MLNFVRKKPIKGINLVKKFTALMLASSFAVGASGCKLDNNDSSLSVSSSAIDNISSNDLIREDVLESLYIPYGLMDLIENKYNLDSFQGFSDERKQIIAECTKDLEIYFSTSDRKTAKNALDHFLEESKKIYDGRKLSEVIQEIFLYLLPGTAYFSADNKHFEDESREGFPLSRFNHSYKKNKTQSIIDFDDFMTFISKGKVDDINDINGAISNLNKLLHIYGTYYEDRLVIFDSNGGSFYVGNKTLLTDLLFEYNAYYIMDHDGIFDSFNVIYYGGDSLDVLTGDFSIYKIQWDENDENFIKILEHLSDNQITSNTIKNNDLMPLILESLKNKNKENKKNKQR